MNYILVGILFICHFTFAQSVKDSNYPAYLFFLVARETDPSPILKHSYYADQSNTNLNLDARSFRYCLDLKNADGKNATELSNCTLGQVNSLNEKILRSCVGEEAQEQRISESHEQIKSLLKHDRIWCQKLKDDFPEVYKNHCGIGRNSSRSYIQQVNRNMRGLISQDAHNSCTSLKNTKIKWSVDDATSLLCQKLKEAWKLDTYERAPAIDRARGEFFFAMSMIRMASAGCSSDIIKRFEYKRSYISQMMEESYSDSSDFSRSQRRRSIEYGYKLKEKHFSSESKSDRGLQFAAGSGATVRKSIEAYDSKVYADPIYRWVNEGIHPADLYLYDRYEYNTTLGDDCDS